MLIRTAASLLSAGTERAVKEFSEKNLIEKARARPDLVRQTVDKARREGLAATRQAVQSKLDQPMPMGYSSSGVVLEVDDHDPEFQVGQRVACAGGGYAVHSEIVTVPRNLVAPVPASVDLDAAAFTTVGAIALHGVRIAQPQMGEVVAVIGLGLVGQLVAQLLASSGCVVLGFDPRADRCDLARRLAGAETATTDDEMKALCKQRSAGFGADAVIIAADTKSDDPVSLAGDLARDRAKVVAVGAVGFGLPRRDYYYKELEFLVSRSYGPGRYDVGYEEEGVDYPIGYVRWTENRNMRAFLGALERRRIDVKSLITHRFSIEAARDAYSLLSPGASEPSLGVLLTYPQMDAPADLRRVIDISMPTVKAARTKAGIGILGAGNFISSTFLPAVHGDENLRLRSIASRSGVTARTIADRYGIESCTSDEHSVFADDQVTAVVIATPHNMHAKQVTEALLAQKHVYCEKPLCITATELEGLLPVVRDATTLLQVGFNRRFAALAVDLKATVDSLEGPAVMSYRINAGPLPSDHWLLDPLVGGGRIIGEGCHFIDFLQFLCGSVPVSVRTIGAGNRPSSQDVSIQMEFGDGSIGTVIYASTGDKAFGKERIEILRGGGVAVLDDFRELEVVRDGKRKVTKSRFKQDKGHAASFAAFLSSIRRGGKPPVSYRDIFATTVASFKAVESLKSGDVHDIDLPGSSLKGHE